jgi:hypothetical protein
MSLDSCFYGYDTGCLSGNTASAVRFTALIWVASIRIRFRPANWPAVARALRVIVQETPWRGFAHASTAIV